MNPRYIIAMNPRYIIAHKLREQGLTYKQIGLHPQIGPVSAERARQIVKGYEWRYKQEQRRQEAMCSITGETMGVMLDDLPLSVRTQNALRNAGLVTVKDLTNYGKSKLMRIHNFGKKSCFELQNFLANLGIPLGE